MNFPESKTVEGTSHSGTVEAVDPRFARLMELYEERYDRLVWFARRTSGDIDEAENAVQSAMAHILEKRSWEEIQHIECCYTWLCTNVRRQVTELRRAKGQHFFDETVSIDDRLPFVESRVSMPDTLSEDLMERKQTVDKVLSEMNPNFSSALRALMADSHPEHHQFPKNKDLAFRLGIRESTLKTRIMRARQHMFEALSCEEDFDDLLRQYKKWGTAA